VSSLVSSSAPPRSPLSAVPPAALAPPRDEHDGLYALQDEALDVAPPAATAHAGRGGAGRGAAVCIEVGAAADRGGHRAVLLACGRAGCGRREARAREFARCSRCRRIVYCSRACQMESHRAGHRAICAVLATHAA